MKKILFTILSLCSLFFASCYDPVLYNIRGDVKPEPAEISGTIQTITRYSTGGQDFLVLIAESNDSDNTKLFAENKNTTNIYYKPVSSSAHGEWKKYDNSPVTEAHHYHYEESEHLGEQLLLTHATSDTLYVFTAEYNNDTSEGTSYPSKFHCYAKQIALADETTLSTEGEWVDILANDSAIDYLPIYKDNSYYSSAFSVFSTNAVQPSHRKVYIRSGDEKAKKEDLKTVTYYELSGLNAPSPVTISPSDSTESNSINSAAYFNGGVIFFNSITCTTNETAETDATTVYYGDGQYIYSKSLQDTEFKKSEFKAGHQISTLCVCKDSLLMGRAEYSSTGTSALGGIVKTSLDENGNIGSALTAFESNAELQLSSTYFILALLNVDPSKTEAESTLYATIDFFGSGTSNAVSYDNVGLWSYYPNRGNWNRE